MTTSGYIMDLAAALYNDQEKAVATYAVQLPYLNLALKELQELYEENNVPVTDVVSALIAVVAGVTEINATTTPALPTDLVEIRQMWERPTGVDPFIPMYRRDFLPHYLEGVRIPQLIWWSNNNNGIQFLPASADNEIKLDYTRNLFTVLTNSDGSDNINVINCELFLANKTAALLSRFIGENGTRADILDGAAYLAIERSMNITTKGRQAMVKRRRPFRAAWRTRQVY